MYKNPFEDLFLMDKKISEIKQRAKMIDTRSDTVEKKKHRLQNHINTIDENLISDEIVERYNTLTLNLHEIVQIRKGLAETWKKLANERNEINAFSEYLEKYYGKLKDGGEITQLMNNQIEERLILFMQLLVKQEEILTRRLEILLKEEDYISQSEQLLGI